MTHSQPRRPSFHEVLRATDDPVIRERVAGLEYHDGWLVGIGRWFGKQPPRVSYREFFETGRVILIDEAGVEVDDGPIASWPDVHAIHGSTV